MSLSFSTSDLQPMYLYSGLKMVLRCPLSVTPSSMIRPSTVISALFLLLMMKSAPMISAIAPCPFLQYLRMRSLKVDLSDPVCPKIPCWARSLAWSRAERLSPSWSSKGGRTVCFSRYFLASFHTILPSLVSQMTSSQMGISFSLMKEASCLSMREMQYAGNCLARFIYFSISDSWLIFLLSSGFRIVIKFHQ